MANVNATLMNDMHVGQQSNVLRKNERKNEKQNINHNDTVSHRPIVELA